MMSSYPAGRAKTLRGVMRGITLPELLIVLVIVGIITSIAYPQYREFVSRAKRSEAKAALMKIAQNQERFYLDNNTFTNDMTNLGFSGSNDVLTDSETYSVTITAANASNFTAVATYQRDDAEKDKCLTFTITGADQRTSAPDSDCWTRTR